MVKFSACIKILRPKNALMAAGAVILGFWVSRSSYPLQVLAFMVISAICSVGFGNIINDIRDREPDKINHPDRPIARGDISITGASIWAAILLLCGLGTAYLVSIQHFLGCLIPLIMLAVYAVYLKSTPLAGNITISILVAYALIFGAMGSPDVFHLIIPAFLAFMLNLCREIVKDIQDKPGDIRYGIQTTAILPSALLRGIFIWISAAYLLFVFLPFFTAHFGAVYLGICALAVIPLHVAWLMRIIRHYENARLALVSSLIKAEMLTGLAAIAADTFFAHPKFF